MAQKQKWKKKMTNNPWNFLPQEQQFSQMQPMDMQQLQPMQMPQQPQQQQSDQYPTLPNQYGLGAQQAYPAKKEQPGSGAVSTSPWLWGGESNSR